jgi:hypothetical protein
VTEQEATPKQKSSPEEKAFDSAVDIYLDKQIEHGRGGVRVSKPPTILHHYTTVEGIQGILRDGCLHASAAYYLNDSSEIDYGCILFASVLKKWFDQNQEKLSKREVPIAIPEILWSTKQAFGSPESLQPVLFHVYVTCFCEDENLLSQWRAYGQSGGYSIGFRRPALEHGFGVHGGWHRVRLSRVVYDLEEQNLLLTRLMTDAIATILDPHVEGLITGLEEKQRLAFVSMFRWFIDTMALAEIARFKHPAFREEKEWRLVVRPLPGGTDAKKTGKLKFKPSRGMLTPYLELSPREDKSLLPIESVRYGPTLERRRAENVLNLFLRQRGYTNVQLHGSEIPVRL